MNWMLILTIWISGSIETRLIDVESKAACEAAAASVKRDFAALAKAEKVYIGVNATCINRRAG